MSESVARRLSLIGRRNEKQSIINAIQDQNLRIIFLEGDPGIGKTVLLQEARRIAHELGLISPPIVDFYDTKMHAHRDLEDAIANNLDLGEEAFREYRVRREQMERTLAREHKTLKEQEEELWGLFVEGYNHVAKERRVLLCFDTAELLEYEQDSEEVMADCEVSPQDAPSWEWLLNRIGELENTVVLIAARPTPTGLLKQGLLEAHRDCVTAIEVRGFTLEETKAYFEADDGFGSEVANKDPETVTKVHLLTNGRPILIALALDWLARGTWESEIYPASLEELETWQAEAQEEERKGHQGKAWQQWNEVKRKFEVALVEHIRTLDHSGLDVAVKYAALARKGCNAELLALLMDSSPQEAEGHVEQLLDLSFVKQPRGNRKLFFLHDEMYDLVEKYVWRVQWPDHTRQAMLDKIIIDWYEQQIKDLGQQIKGCRIWEERSKMRRQQQHIMVERLYYQLDTDPQQGYREYSRLDEQAIGSRELDWDVLLRNEVLWFTAHRGWRLVAKGPTQQRNGKIERSPWVDYDCRRRWVNRYIARGEWKKAVRIAEKLLARPQHAEESRFALYRPGLHIALGTAQAYLGGVTSELALQNLDDGIRIIEDSAEQALEEHQNPWLASYLLGTANLYKGVALRNTLRLAETANAYRQATRYYRQIEYLPGQAEALNNLAYIYARQGKPRRALSPCDEALRIREELGDEYPIGLSLNTKGIIYERLGLPETACRFSQQALKLFQNIPNERGIVLAEINLGRSLRRKGRSLEWGKKHDFSRADKNLSDAVSRLEGWGANREVFYEVEAYNEWGCVYRDWVATLYERGEQKPRELIRRLEQSVEKLEKAQDLLGGKGAVSEANLFQYIDCTEDLARVYYWRARVDLEHQTAFWTEALGLLGEAKELIEHIHDRDEYPFLLGKIYHQYARIYRAQGDNERAAKHYARSAGLLEKYSHYLPELRKTVADACDWLYELSLADEVERSLVVMSSTSEEEDLESIRLQEWIDDRLLTRFGIGWPDTHRRR